MPGAREWVVDGVLRVGACFDVVGWGDGSVAACCVRSVDGLAGVVERESGGRACMCSGVCRHSSEWVCFGGRVGWCAGSRCAGWHSTGVPVRSAWCGADLVSGGKVVVSWGGPVGSTGGLCVEGGECRSRPGRRWLLGESILGWRCRGIAGQRSQLVVAGSRAPAPRVGGWVLFGRG